MKETNDILVRLMSKFIMILLSGLFTVIAFKAIKGNVPEVSFTYIGYLVVISAIFYIANKAAFSIAKGATREDAEDTTDLEESTEKE